MLPRVVLIKVATIEEMFSTGISGLKSKEKMKEAKIVQVGLINNYKIELD